MSKFGIALCLTYLLIILVCLEFSLSAAGDFKGQFVVAKIMIALQGSLSIELDLGPMMQERSWLDAYLYLAGSTFVLANSPETIAKSPMPFVCRET